MINAFSGGWFSISIDVPTQNQSTRPGVLSHVKQLVRIFADHAVSATWAIDDPSQSDVVDTLLAAGAGHELALLGDADWIGRRAGRTVFARELKRRVDAARSAGFMPSTLAIRDIDLDGNLDLLVRHRISAVRGGDFNRPVTNHPIRPYSLRYGVWQIAATNRLLGNGGWWFAGDAFPIKRAINRALVAGDFVHLAVDAQRVAELDGATRTMERILRHVDLHKQHGALATKTLAKVAGSMNRLHEAPAGGSALRAAA